MAIEIRPDRIIHAWEAPIVSLPTRQVTNWTPDDIAFALAAASAGNLMQAADVTNAILRDDRVRGVLSTRTLGMLALPQSWDEGEPEGWATYAPTSELNKLLTWGLSLGVGISYIHPDGCLETWHPRWLRVDTQARKWYIQSQHGEHLIEPGGGEWILYTPYGVLEPYFDGLWTALAIPWLIKQFAVHDRARASEVFGSPAVVGKTEGASETQRRRWLEELKGLSRSSRIVLPEGYSMDLMEAQGQTWGIYKQGADWADTAMTITIAGQLVTTMGTTGWNAGDIHQAISHALIKFGADTLTACLAEQYVKPVWAEKSTPSYDIDPPSKVFDTAKSLNELGAAIETLNQAVHGDNLKVDTRALAKTYSIPLRPRSDEAPKIQINLAPTDIARAVSLNEARESLGLKEKKDATGIRSPLGDLPLAVAAEIEAQRLAPAISEEGDQVKPAAALARILLSLIAEKEVSVAAAARPASVVTVRCRGIDVSKEPEEFRIFERGKNATDHGTFLFSPRSAKSLMLARGDRDCMIDLEHLSLMVDSPNFDPDARGWCRLQLRNGELWAVNVRWTDDGKNRIRSKKQRYISPAFKAYAKTGEITSLTNMALTALPAMHNTPSLIAAAATKGKSMDPQILAMLGLPETATLADVLAALAALTGAAAGAAADAGADATAQAADAAAAATEDAAAEAAAEGAGESEAAAEESASEESALAAVAATANAAMQRLDRQERAALMSGRNDLAPGFKKTLEGLPVATVKKILASLPRAESRTAKTGSAAASTGAMTAEDMHLCRKLQIDPAKFQKQREQEIAARAALNGGSR